MLLKVDRREMLHLVGRHPKPAANLFDGKLTTGEKLRIFGADLVGVDLHSREGMPTVEPFSAPFISSPSRGEWAVKCRLVGTGHLGRQLDRGRGGGVVAVERGTVCLLGDGQPEGLPARHPGPNNEPPSGPRPRRWKIDDASIASPSTR